MNRPNPLTRAATLDYVATMLEGDTPREQIATYTRREADRETRCNCPTAWNCPIHGEQGDLEDLDRLRQLARALVNCGRGETQLDGVALTRLLETAGR